MHAILRPFPLALMCVGLLALITSACPGPGYPHCEGDATCADRREVCVFGSCHECALDSHCGAGNVCKNYKCASLTGCTKDAECSDGKICKAGACTLECRADADCPAGNACENNRCVKKEPVCKDHKDCAQGQACRGGKCFVPGPNDPEYSAIFGPVAEPVGPGNSGIDFAGNRALCGTEIRVYFGFNEAGVTDEGRELLGKAAQCLKQNPTLSVTIQGHTDERGSTEYNLALGERRALSVRGYLKDLGIDEKRLIPVSVGEERPLDSGKDEAAWAKNRRAELYPRAP